MRTGHALVTPREHTEVAIERGSNEVNERRRVDTCGCEIAQVWRRAVGQPCELRRCVLAIHGAIPARRRKPCPLEAHAVAAYAAIKVRRPDLALERPVYFEDGRAVGEEAAILRSDGVWRTARADTPLRMSRGQAWRAATQSSRWHWQRTCNAEPKRPIINVVLRNKRSSLAYESDSRR